MSKFSQLQVFKELLNMLPWVDSLESKHLLSLNHHKIVIASEHYFRDELKVLNDDGSELNPSVFVRWPYSSLAVILFDNDNGNGKIGIISNSGEYIVFGRASTEYRKHWKLRKVDREAIKETADIQKFINSYQDKDKYIEREISKPKDIRFMSEKGKHVFQTIRIVALTELDDFMEKIELNSYSYNYNPFLVYDDNMANTNQQFDMWLRGIKNSAQPSWEKLDIPIDKFQDDFIERVKKAIKLKKQFIGIKQDHINWIQNDKQLKFRLSCSDELFEIITGKIEYLKSKPLFSIDAYEKLVLKDITDDNEIIALQRLALESLEPTITSIYEFYNQIDELEGAGLGADDKRKIVGLMRGFRDESIQFSSIEKGTSIPFLKHISDDSIHSFYTNNLDKRYINNPPHHSRQCNEEISIEHANGLRHMKFLASTINLYVNPRPEINIYNSYFGYYSPQFVITDQKNIHPKQQESIKSGEKVILQIIDNKLLRIY